MADTLSRQSPLQDWQSRFAELPSSTQLAEEPCVTMVDLWVDPTGRGRCRRGRCPRCRRAAHQRRRPRSTEPTPR